MRNLLLIFLFAGVLRAEDLYFTQSGSGAHDGTVGNPWSVSEASTSGNWGAGAGKISAGDTLHAVGTLTTALTVQGSGTNGSPITILFDSGAKFSAAAWASTGAITITSKDYITIDGGTNGLIENTNNGSVSLGYANQVASQGVAGSNCNNFIVKNLAVNNLYIRVASTDTLGDSNWCIVNRAPSAAITNFTVQNCTGHDAERLVLFEYYAGSTGFSMTGCTAYNMNWGAGCAQRNNSATLVGLTISGNTFYNWSNWNDTSGSNTYHHNGFFAYADSGATISTVSIYGNTFGPGWGNAYQTSGIYFSGSVAAPLIYNNVFVASAGEYAANGMIYFGAVVGTSTRSIYNNTFSTGGTGNAIDVDGSGATALTVIIKNNLINGNGGGTFIAIYNNGTVSLTSDYNLSYGLTAANAYSYSSSGSANYLTFSQWKTATSGDANSINGSDPLLTGTYRLSAGSPAIGQGTDLSAYFTTDAAGYTRSVPWDIGAYKWLGGGSAFSGTLTLAGNASLK